jgi:phosphatidylglycerol:prolipoprotein diacylglycerol transferase
MYPELFRVGPLVVNSYGLMLALAFIVGIFLALKKAEKRGIDNNTIINLAFVVMVSAIVGSRLFYVLFHLEEFKGRWLYTFLPIQPDGSIGLGGLIFLGGFLGAILSGAIYIQKKGLSFWKVVDSVAPSLALGLFFGRIGCFLNGCCFGKTCSLPWAVTFPPNSAAGYQMAGVAIHPTQLYSSAYGLLIFIILMLLDRKKHYDGFLFAIFLMLYGVSRFTVDFFRFYESQMFLIDGIGFNQILSFLLVVSGIILLLMKKTGDVK